MSRTAGRGQRLWHGTDGLLRRGATDSGGERTSQWFGEHLAGPSSSASSEDEPEGRIIDERDDAQLLAAVERGDRDALRELHDRHAGLGSPRRPSASMT